MIDANKIKEDFPILNQKIKEKPLIYLDNSATTQKPKQVIDAITKFYQEDNANIHRGVHELATRATIGYQKSRETVATFLNAVPEEIIFIRGTTDGFNKIVNSIRKSKILKENDEIILSILEHHANIVPWQELAKEIKFKIKWIPITDNYELDLTKLPNLITNKTKILSITHCSNVTGTINPIKQIISQAKQINKDIITIIDAAQSVPHQKINVKDLDCDILIFSSHKLLGPTGIGIIYGKADFLNKLEPFNYGGDMIEEVTKESSTWNELPHKFEAGTPSIAQAVGLNAAIEYLNNLGMKKIHKHLDKLTTYTLTKLKEIEGLSTIGPNTSKNRAPIFTFTLKTTDNKTIIHPHDVGEILNREGIAIRGGKHCAMPLYDEIKVPEGASRASFYIYNTTKDTDKLIKAIKKAQEVFS